MDWKKILANIATGLTVSIIAGIVVWLVTRPSQRVEGVAYEATPVTVFGGASGQYAFFTVTVSNRGDTPATNVQIEISDENGGRLSELTVRRSASKPLVQVTRLPSGLSAKIPRFLPSEQTSFSALYRASKAINPDVIVKTDSGIAQRIEDTPESIQAQSASLFAILLGFAASAFAVRGFFKSYARKPRFRFFFRDKNNSGFMLFHAGLTKEALAVFEAAIASGESGPIPFSNIAAANAVLGDHERAQKLIDIAEGWADLRHDKAVTLFNKAIVDQARGDASEAANNLTAAMSLSPEIRLYLDRSDLCRQLFSKDPITAEFYAA